MKVNRNKGKLILTKQIYLFAISDYKFVYETHSVPLASDPPSNEMEIVLSTGILGISDGH